MKKRYLIVLIVLFLIITPNVNAAMCDKTDILRVKGEANNVNIEYELIQNKDGSDNISGLFNIRIKGLTEDLIVDEEKTGRSFSSGSAVDGVITIKNVEGEKFVFKLRYKKCDNKVMRTIKINLPKYNEYSLHESCEGISEEELEICGKWYQGELNEEIFQKKIKEYQEELKLKQEQEQKENTIFKRIVRFLLNYYIYIITAVVLIAAVITAIIVRRKRYSLD